MTSEKVAIEADIQAPVETVWRCWTAPEHMVQWNFASEDWRCPSAENDLRVGGRCRSRMEAKDGSFGFDMEYVYDEVLPQQKLSYTLTDGRTVQTRFESVGGATRVSTLFDPEKQNPAEMQQAGWQAILNNFKAYVERQ